MKTINHEYYVSYEIAKLLKELGFDWECNYHYTNSNMLCHGFCNNDPIFKVIMSAPTLDVAQRWLREEKLYNVLVDTGGYKNYEYFIDYHGVKEGPNYPFHEYNHNLICNTYEEALEAGIKKTLELILGEGE
jgi:hypothetical protein